MKQKGYTLIEIMVVIVIIGVVASMGMPFVVEAVEAWITTQEERDSLFVARLAMQRMVREIRQLEDTSTIATFTQAEFEFDKFEDAGPVNITFSQSGTSLLRNANELAYGLVDPGGLVFEYLDQSLQATAVRDEIKMVRITLIIDKGRTPVVLESLARFRNE